MGTDDREEGPPRVRLGVEHPVWDRFFMVNPLVVVATREPDGTWDLAPKHMVTPLGWENFFGFVCTPRHATWVNAIREGSFTVSFPRPSQILQTSLTAAPRCDRDDTKPALDLVETIPATVVDGVVLRDAYLHLECETDRVIDGFGDNGLVVGRIVEALVADDAIRRADRDDEDVIFETPLLVYVAPGRWAEITRSFAFPFHEGFSR